MPKYNYKKDALTDYFKGKLSAKELDKIARDDFKSGIATKKELSNFLSNKFTQDVMSDTYGIPAGTLVKRVRGLMKFAEGVNEMDPHYPVVSKDDEEEVTESKFAKKPEVTPKQLLKIQNDVRKVNRKIKVYISKHPVTKGQLDIELGHGHDNDDEIHKIYAILKKHTGSWRTGSMFNESVNEGKEPEVISQLRDIVKRKQNKKIKDPKSGKMMRVDLMSASVVTQVYDKINKSNKDKFGKLSLPNMVNLAYKVAKPRMSDSVNERINPKFYDARVQYIDPKSKKKFVGDVVRYDNGEYKVNLGKDGRFEKYILAKEKDLKIVSKSKKRTYESVNEGISVFDERHFGKKGIIIMIDDNGKKVSAIFKDKKNADKFNRNKPSDIKKLLDLAKKTKYPKAIDESVNEAYVVLYSPKKGVKPVSTAAYKDKKDAEKWAKDLGGITMIVKKNVRYIDESVNEDKKQIKDLVKRVKFEKIFYDVLSTMEKKFGKRKYRIWLEKSLKDFGENPKHYDYRTNAAAEEKLFQLGKK